jgi:hypothetical protein
MDGESGGTVDRFNLDARVWAKCENVAERFTPIGPESLPFRRAKGDRRLTTLAPDFFGLSADPSPARGPNDRSSSR